MLASRSDGMQFVNPDVASRLGCAGGRAAVEQHAFFASVAWKLLADRAVEPPFRPDARPGEALYTDPTLADAAPVVSL